MFGSPCKESSKVVTLGTVQQRAMLKSDLNEDGRSLIGKVLCERKVFRGPMRLPFG